MGSTGRAVWCVPASRRLTLRRRLPPVADDQRPMTVPHGPEVALRGLGEAVERLRPCNEGLLRGRGTAPAVIALSEALFWVKALDDRLRDNSRNACYYSDRDAAADGQTVAGLTYARNFHTHQLLSLTKTDSEAYPATVEHHPDSGRTIRWSDQGIFRVWLRWAPLTELPDPERTDSHRRDEFYDDRVGGRELCDPLDGALAWLRGSFDSMSE